MRFKKAIGLVVAVVFSFGAFASTAYADDNGDSVSASDSGNGGINVSIGARAESSTKTTKDYNPAPPPSAPNRVVVREEDPFAATTVDYQTGNTTMWVWNKRNGTPTVYAAYAPVDGFLIHEFTWNTLINYVGCPNPAADENYGYDGGNAIPYSATPGTYTIGATVKWGTIVKTTPYNYLERDSLTNLVIGSTGVPADKVETTYYIKTDCHSQTAAKIISDQPCAQAGEAQLNGPYMPNGSGGMTPATAVAQGGTLTRKNSAGTLTVVGDKVSGNTPLGDAIKVAGGNPKTTAPTPKQADNLCLTVGKLEWADTRDDQITDYGRYQADVNTWRSHVKYVEFAGSHVSDLYPGATASRNFFWNSSKPGYNPKLILSIWGPTKEYEEYRIALYCKNGANGNWASSPGFWKQKAPASWPDNNDPLFYSFRCSDSTPNARLSDAITCGDYVTQQIVPYVYDEVQVTAGSKPYVLETKAQWTDYREYTWNQGLVKRIPVSYTYHTEWRQTGSHSETYQSGTETYVTGQHAVISGYQQVVVGQRAQCTGMFCAIVPIYATYPVYTMVNDYGTRPTYATRTVADYGNVTVRDGVPANSNCVTGAPSQCTYSDNGSTWVRTEPLQDTPPASDTPYPWVDNGAKYERAGYPGSDYTLDSSGKWVNKNQLPSGTSMSTAISDLGLTASRGWVQSSPGVFSKKKPGPAGWYDNGSGYVKNVTSTMRVGGLLAAPIDATSHQGRWSTDAAGNPVFVAESTGDLYNFTYQRPKFTVNDGKNGGKGTPLATAAVDTVRYQTLPLLSPQSSPVLVSRNNGLAKFWDPNASDQPYAMFVNSNPTQTSSADAERFRNSRWLGAWVGDSVGLDEASPFYTDLETHRSYVLRFFLDSSRDKVWSVTNWTSATATIKADELSLPTATITYGDTLGTGSAADFMAPVSARVTDPSDGRLLRTEKVFCPAQPITVKVGRAGGGTR